MPEASASWEKFPLVVPLDQRYSDSTIDSLMTNCFAHKNDTGDLMAVRRDGFQETAYSPSGVRMAGGIFAGDDLVAGDTGAYCIAQNTTTNDINLYFNGAHVVTLTAAAAVATAPIMASWNQTGQVASPQYYMNVDFTGPGYFADDVSGFQKITDVNFPATLIPGSALLNGILYVCDTIGQVWGTAGQDDFSVWSATNVINAFQTAGTPVQIHRHLNEVVVFKSHAAEVFYDAGNATGSPLLPVEQVTIKIGAARYTIQEIGSETFWVSVGPNGEYRVQRMPGFAPAEISTSAVNRILQQSVDAFSFRSWQTDIYGYTFYCISVVKPDETITLGFNITTNEWFRLNCVIPDGISTGFPVYFMGSSQNQEPATQPTAAFPIASHPYFLMANGKIFHSAPESGYDQTHDGAVYSVEQRSRTPNFTGGTTVGKYLSQVRMIASQRTPGIVFVRFSDDDYQTWSSWRSFNMSDRVPMMPYGGTFTKRAWEIKYSGTNNVLIQSLEGFMHRCDR